MNQDEAISWLTAWKVKSIFSAIFCAVGGLIFSVILLAMAWAFVFMVCIHIMGGWRHYFGGWVQPLVATLSVPLLFFGNALIDPETLGKYSVTTGTTTDKPVTIPGVGSTVNPLRLNSIVTIFKIVADVLFSGPRVTIWSFNQIARGWRLLWVDVRGCAAVLALLHNTGHRMSYRDISTAIQGLNPVRVFNQLRMLDGVLFLVSEPPGLSLRTDLKDELARTSRR